MEERRGALRGPKTESACQGSWDELGGVPYKNQIPVKQVLPPAGRQ